MDTRPVRNDPVAAFGYLRRLPGMDDEAVKQAAVALSACSVAQGFVLADVHYEHRPGERLDTWTDLISDCRSKGVVNVLVPSPDRFHHDPAVAAFMRQELADQVQGSVRYADDRAGITESGRS